MRKQIGGGGSRCNISMFIFFQSREQIRVEIGDFFFLLNSRFLSHQINHLQSKIFPFSFVRAQSQRQAPSHQGNLLLYSLLSLLRLMSLFGRLRRSHREPTSPHSGHLFACKQIIGRQFGRQGDPIESGFSDKVRSLRFRCLVCPFNAQRASEVCPERLTKQVVKWNLSEERRKKKVDHCLSVASSSEF